MRNLIFAINLTLDGCCDHTKVIGDEEVHEYHAKLVREADTFVYGRVTYQLMVPYWFDVARNHAGEKKETIEFAQAFDAIKKIVVFSRTLDSADEMRTRIVRTDIKEEILRLKSEPGKNILTGGVDIPLQLMELDLIDEYRFVVQPLIVGEGRRLLEGISLAERLQLKLVETKNFKSGMVALRYSRR